MQKRLLFAAIAVAIVCAVAFIGYRLRQGSDGTSQGVVRVGAIIPQTGEVATYGDSLKKGFDLAAEDCGGQIQVIYEDSRASPKDGVTAMQKLLSQGVRHFLGDATSGVCLAIAPLANQNDALLMISIATSDDLSRAGPYVFRNCPPNWKQAGAAAKFIADDLKAKKVAIVFKAGPYGANLAAQFRKDAASRNLSIVLDEQYEPSLRDFTTIVEKLRSRSPDAVFVPGNYEETALLLRKAHELAISIPFIGTDGAYSEKLVELAGPAAEKFYLTMLGLDKSSAFYQQFETAYKRRYGGEPNVFTAYGYEGASILFKVIRDGGTVPDQRERLASGRWGGLLGQVSFDSQGQVVRSVQILQVHSGRFVAYEGPQ